MVAESEKQPELPLWRRETDCGKAASPEPRAHDLGKPTLGLGLATLSPPGSGRAAETATPAARKSRCAKHEVATALEPAKPKAPAVVLQPVVTPRRPQRPLPPRQLRPSLSQRRLSWAC